MTLRAGARATIAAAWLGTIVLTSYDVAAQASDVRPPAARPPMADEVFKNIQLLKGIPVDQFMGTMGFFSSSTGLNCTDCHSYDSGGDWAKYADDTPLKRTARRMIAMMQMINAANFGGRQMVTCNTCHRGVANPNVMPSINQLYASPPPEEPGDPIVQAQGQPSAESVIDKYIAAVGGAQKVAAFTSFTGTGTYKGYDDAEASPMEFAATAMGQISTIAHPASGTITIASDGRAGWSAYPLTDRPFPLIALSGQELDGIRLQAQLFFPSQIKSALRNWRTGFPTEIDDRRVNVIQGNLGAMGVATLCFDMQTGLLVRMIRYGPSPVGRIVTRIDYSDYRDVGSSSVKIPFKWTVSWLDGRNVFALTRADANVRIDPAKFAKPAVK
jgi:photosynthetic reaction center cytochrome c subunit